jgi:hypothetical protein
MNASDAPLSSSGSPGDGGDAVEPCQPKGAAEQVDKCYDPTRPVKVLQDDLVDQQCRGQTRKETTSARESDSRPNGLSHPPQPGHAAVQQVKDTGSQG